MRTTDEYIDQVYDLLKDCPLEDLAVVLMGVHDRFGEYIERPRGPVVDSDSEKTH